MNKRVIPCLLIKDRGLVKTIKFRKPDYIGDPINAIRIFNEKEVDELIVVDFLASKQSRAPDVDFIKEIVGEAFMPIAYGGGVTALEHIDQILRVGVERVSINSSAVLSIEFMAEACREYGSSTIIGSLDVKRDFLGRERVFHLNGKVNTKKNPVAYARELEQAGIGELFINFADRDGTYSGYDLDLIRQITDSVSIPTIACGGAGSLADVRSVLIEGKASGAAAGSIFVYYGQHQGVLINYPDQDSLAKVVQE